MTMPKIPYTLVPRMQIVWDVLERANEVGDDHVISACHRLMAADCIGWHKHHHPADWELVQEFADVVCAEVPFPD